MSSITTKEIKTEIPHIIRVYTDGSVERLWSPPTVPATIEDPETGVSSKDVTLSSSTGLIARLYLPKLTNTPTQQKFPIVIYFHGGGFCLKSAFSSTEHRYMNFLASQAQVVIVNVEYRLAPEHTLPAAYDDAWTALNSLSSLNDPWIANHGNLEAVFVGGDSAGGNIAHNLAMRAGSEQGSVKIQGLYLCHAYFLGPKRVGTRKPEHDFGFNKEVAFRCWELAYPEAGPDHPMINPLVKDAPGMKVLGCNKVLVVVGEKDDIVDWCASYYNGLRESGFGGSVELFEVKGEGHSFQLFNPTSDNAKLLIQRLASFFHDSSGL